jgi:hypothetical protein
VAERADLYGAAALLGLEPAGHLPAGHPQP